MRRSLVLTAVLALLALPAVASAVTRTGQFRGSLSADSHSPSVNSRWFFNISAKTLKNRPLRASAHIQVFENGKRVNIIGWRQFKGTYRDSYRWPGITRGHQYVFQVLLIATGANHRKSTLTLNYPVSPQ